MLFLFGDMDRAGGIWMMGLVMRGRVFVLEYSLQRSIGKTIFSWFFGVLNEVVMVVVWDDGIGSRTTVWLAHPHPTREMELADRPASLLVTVSAHLVSEGEFPSSTPPPRQPAIHTA